MTEEVTEAAGPNAKELDLVALFAGMEHPKSTVDVYLNAKVAYEAHRLQKEMSRLATLGEKDALIAAEEEYDNLVKENEKYKYTFYLTGTTPEVRNSVLTTIEKDYPVETDLLGRAKPSPERDVAFENRLWAVHIEKISGPEGTLVAPTEEAIAYFRGNAPDAASRTIANAILELTEGVTEGLESLVKSEDFLSQP